MEESFFDKVMRVVLVSSKNVFRKDKERRSYSDIKVSTTLDSLDSENANIEDFYIVDPVFYIEHKMLKNFLKFPYKVEMKLKISHVNSKILFEIARQQTYLKLTQEAYYNLETGSNKWNYEKFVIWKCFLAVCYPKLLNEEKVSCCGKRKNKINRKKFKKIIEETSNLKNSIEKNLTLLEISLNNSVKVGKHIEPWQFYAGQVLKIDRYYGYLAFGCGYLRTDPKKGLEILQQLTLNNQTIPFSYLVLWEYYYGKGEHGLAMTTSFDCFSRITENKFSAYFNLILVMYIKSLVKLKQFKTALDLLRDKYLESQNDLFYLYLFGKFCVKSKDKNHLNDGLSALKEVLRSIKDYIKINYWYGVACYKTGRLLKAKKHFNRVVLNLNRNQIKYSIKIQKFFNKIENYLNEISSFQSNLESGLKVSYHPTPDHFLNQHFQLIQAECFFKAGQIYEALEELDSVKLPGGFRLLLKIVGQLDPEQAKERLVSQLERLNNFKIPLFELIDSCILYTDYLVSIKSFDSALIILESMLLFYPKNYENLPFVSKSTSLWKSGLGCYTSKGKSSVYLAILKKNIRLSLNSLHPNFPKSKSSSFEDLSPEIEPALNLFVLSDASVLFKIHKVLENLADRVEDQITCLQDFLQISSKAQEVAIVRPVLMNLLKVRCSN